MDKCFVIQPFDGGKFDKRFEDTFCPAIEASGLSPYRVDKDPGASIPIEEIENKIAGSRICFADISTDNPNVWFELGYAIASAKDVILVCAAERQGHFPFDVQHRAIIRYATDSARDFEELKIKITERARAILERQETLGGIRNSLSPTKTFEGLEQHELAALVTIAQEVEAADGCISVASFKDGMERAGFTRLASAIAVQQLTEKGFVAATSGRDYEGDEFSALEVTRSGFKWLVENRATLALTAAPKRPIRPAAIDEDIPF